MAVIFSDGFTEAADTALDAHAPDTGSSWVEVWNTTGTDIICVGGGGVASPAATVNSTGAGYKSQPDPASAEYDVLITEVGTEGLVDSGTKPWGLFARLTDVNNAYFFRRLPDNHASNSHTLYKRVGGTVTQLASADIAETVPSTYKFEIRDAAKKLFVNASELLSTADNALTSAGSCGLFAGSNFGQTSHFTHPWDFDDYSVDVVSSGVSVGLSALGLLGAAAGASVQNVGGAVTVTLARLNMASAAAGLSAQNGNFPQAIPLNRLNMAGGGQKLSAYIVGGPLTVALARLGITGAGRAVKVTTDQRVPLDLLSLTARAGSFIQPSPAPDFRAYIDLDGDGFGAGDEITTYVRDASISIGNNDPFSNVAAVGQAELTLDNADRHFTPTNAGSPFYGKLRPHLNVIIEAARADWPTPIRLFTGRVKSISPESQRYEARYVIIVCEDYLGALQDYDRLAVPLQVSEPTAQTLSMICASAFRGKAASQTLRLYRVDAIQSTLTVGGRQYVFVNGAPAGPYQVKATNDAKENALNLLAAINAGEGIGVRYGSGTLRNQRVAMARPGIEEISTPAVIPTASSLAEVGSSGVMVTAQSVTMPFDGQISKLRLWIAEAYPGSEAHNLVVYMLADSGNQPAGTALYSATVAGPSAGSFAEYYMADSPYFAQGQKIWLVFQTTAPAGQDFRLYVTSDAYAGGGIKTSDTGIGSVWYEPWPDRDLRFDLTIVGKPRIDALNEGEWGNALAISATGNMYTDGATLVGGTNGTPLDLEDDQRVLNVVGGEWRSGEMNAMGAVQEICASLGGFFWVSRGGVPTYRPIDWFLGLPAAAPAMAIDNRASNVNAALSVDNLANVITARATDRRAIVEGVIAEAPEIIAVPGRWGGEPVERWTKNAPTEPGAVTLRLPTINPDTGKYIAALSIYHPVAGVDYTASDFEDEGGFDYTYSDLLRFSIAPAGAELEITISNTALGTLYVKGLKIQGKRFTDATEVAITHKDDASIALYGERAPLTLDLPFSVSLGFADSLARYTLSRYALPEIQADTVSIENPIDLNGVSPYAIEIGDLVSVGDYQAGVSGDYVITGVTYQLSAGAGVDSVQFAIRPIGDQTYCILGASGFSNLDTTARLGV